MANEAQKEPTMEEILASIRRIIAEDETPAGGEQKAKTAEPETPDDHDVMALTRGEESDDVVDMRDEDVFDALLDDSDLDDILPDDDTVTGASVGEALSEDSLVLDELEDTLEEEDALARELLPEEPAAPAESEFSDPVPETEPDPVLASEPEPIVPQTHEEETPVMQATSHTSVRDEVLTDDTPASQAAGAMSKLLGRLDLGGENTLEGLVREMLKPMLKEWLDANLPRIVEAKVEEEVQRISRMAR